MADLRFGHGGLRSQRIKVTFNTVELAVAALEAARLATDDVSHAMAEQARHAHPWENETMQTEDSVFMKPARIDWDYGTVWGEWGVTDEPRLYRMSGLHEVEATRIFNPSDRYREMFTRTYGSDSLASAKILSTKDVALFLEFGVHTPEGTPVGPYPWLYPAWDAHKHELFPIFKKRWEETSSVGNLSRLRLRVPKGFGTFSGRFVSATGVVGSEADFVARVKEFFA